MFKFCQSFFALLLIVLGTLPCHAESAQTQFFICVVTVLSMDGSHFTHDNPTKGRIRVDEVLQGSPLTGELSVVWLPGKLPLCGNDDHPEQSIRWWNNLPMPTFPAGMRQIVWLQIEPGSSSGSVELMRPFDAKTLAATKREVADWETRQKAQARHRAEAESIWTNADVSKLTSKSTDIAVCSIYTVQSESGSFPYCDYHLCATRYDVKERLRDSALATIPRRPTVVVTKNPINIKPFAEQNVIVFLRASQSAYQWQPQPDTRMPIPIEIYSNPQKLARLWHKPVVHPRKVSIEYYRLAFVYYPVDDPAWIIPATPENLAKVRAAIQAGKKPSTPIHHRDVAFELLDLADLMQHIAIDMKGYRSTDNPFSREQFLEIESRLTSGLAKVESIFGKNNLYSADIYNSLAEIQRLENKPAESVASRRKAEEILARMKAECKAIEAL